MSDDKLDTLRKKAAEQTGLAHDFGDLNVEACNGWEHDSGGDDWTRVFFSEDSDGGDTIKSVFRLTFRPGTAEVAAAGVD